MVVDLLLFGRLREELRGAELFFRDEAKALVNQGGGPSSSFLQHGNVDGSEVCWNQQATEQQQQAKDGVDQKPDPTLHRTFTFGRNSVDSCSCCSPAQRKSASGFP